jgi:hypothetical protein
MKEFSECYSANDSIKIGDVVYVTGKVTIGDIINFQNHCDREVKKELIELYQMSGKDIDMRELRSLTADPEYYDQKSASIEGVINLFISVIKRLNKDVDEEYVKNNISIDDVGKISEIISETIPEEETDKEENFPKEKKTKKKVTKK